MSENELLEIFERASHGDRAAAERFFQELLDWEVVFPVLPGQAIEEGEAVLRSGERAYVSTVAEKQIVPVFTSEEALIRWSEQEVPVAKKRFQALLLVLEEPFWLHLNPGSAVGKEFSPWEIETLAKGQAAIQEVIEELGYEISTEISVESTSNQFTDFKQKVRSIFEVYPQIEEVFLAQITQGDQVSLMLCFKQDELSEKQMKTIEEEVVTAGQQAFDLPLHVSFRSEQLGMVEHLTPFYVRQKPISSGGIWNFFRRLTFQSRS